MAFATQPPLDRLIAIVQGLAGMQGTVFRGVPESLPTRVSAYVALAGQTVVDKAGNLLQREARYLVVFGYRVGGAELTAENTIAGLIDAFLTAFYADRRLASTVESARVDVSLADSPEYLALAGQEFRTYPIMVSTTQQQTT